MVASVLIVLKFTDGCLMGSINAVNSSDFRPISCTVELENVCF